jgi:pimeloyl-ACP methyl ester carboxylesterase
MRRAEAIVGLKKISYLISPPSTSAGRHPARNVLFLHAFPLQAAMWEPTFGAVDGWQAVAPDFRGFGQSPLPTDSSYRMTELAGDAIDLLDHLHIAEAVVVGCSMGGYVAFEVMRMAPRYVGALVLVSTRPGADTEEGRANRLKMIDQADREGVDAIADQMIPKLLGATTRLERPDLVEHVRNLAVSNTSNGIKNALVAMMGRNDSTAALEHFKIPTLIVHGLEDTLIPSREAEAMHRAIPNAEYEPMPLTGHLPNLERSATFDARLRQFLDKL